MSVTVPCNLEQALGNVMPSKLTVKVELKVLDTIDRFFVAVAG